VRALVSAVLIVALVVVLGASGSTRRTSAVFGVDARQAREVATVVDFLRAWNGRRLRDVLALLTDDAVGSDCDYRLHRAVLFDGKAEFERWLRKRFSDHDRLVLTRIWNENREESVVVGVDYSKRQSLTLAALGAPAGIVPKSSTKVVFTTAMKIRAFGNGPGGAPPDQQRRICSP